VPWHRLPYLTHKRKAAKVEAAAASSTPGREMETFEATYEEVMGSPPPPLASKRVRDAWPVPLSQLTELGGEETARTPEMRMFQSLGSRTLGTKT
jgi:hypothetical protein